MPKYIVDSNYVRNRPAEKQRMREADQKLLADGSVSSRQMREANSIFAGADMKKARIVSVGKVKYARRDGR